jgi:hypothetical protein
MQRCKDYPLGRYPFHPQSTQRHLLPIIGNREIAPSRRRAGIADAAARIAPDYVRTETRLGLERTSGLHEYVILAAVVSGGDASIKR